MRTQPIHTETVRIMLPPDLKRELFDYAQARRETASRIVRTAIERMIKEQHETA